MKDFKNIADEIMKDITATEELKTRTLRLYRKKRYSHVRSAILSAACIALMLGIAATQGIFPFLPDDGPQVSPLASPDDLPRILMEPSDSTDSPKGELKTWLPDTIEQARLQFGDAFLVPAYLPEGFSLDSISASGYREEAAEEVILYYAKKEEVFSIIQDKTATGGRYNGYEEVDINGVKGYIKHGDGTVLFWIANGVHYSISGQISKDEAVETARSLK